MSLDTNAQDNGNGRMTVWKSKEILGKFREGKINLSDPLLQRAIKHSRLYDTRRAMMIYGELFPTLLEIQRYNLNNKKTLGI